MNKFKKGDTVLMLSGREKAKQSKVTAVFPKTQSVILEDLNQKTHYLKKTQDSEGGLVKKAAPLSWSKVMVVCPSCKAPSRLSIKKANDGKYVRCCKKCGSLLDK